MPYNKDEKNRSGLRPERSAGSPGSGETGPAALGKGRPSVRWGVVLGVACLISLLILGAEAFLKGRWPFTPAAPAPARHATAPPPPRVSVLALDLGAPGLPITPLSNSTAYFDLDNDRFREKTAWITPDDALLAQDVNGNGRIDDITELFAAGGGFADGFARLGALDANHDGVVSAEDPAYARLLLWRDNDSDGYTDKGELMPLDEAGIRSISVRSEQAPSRTPDGQPSAAATSGFLPVHGEVGVCRSVTLDFNQLHTIYGGEVKLSPEALFLPWLRGYGTVKDLSLSVSEDPELQRKVSGMADLPNAAALYGRMDELLARWAGADSIGAAEMRGYFSARRIAILERFTGAPYFQKGTQSSDVHRNAVPYLENAYLTFKLHYFVNFAAQTVWSRMFPDAQYNFALDRIVFKAKASDMASYLAAVANQASPEDLPYLAKALRNMEGDTKVPVASLAPLLAPDRRAAFEQVDGLVLPADAPRNPAG